MTLPHNNPAKDFLLYKSDEPFLQLLGPVQRDLLESSTNDGASYRSIADTRQIPIGTVKSRIHRARERILVLRAEAEAALPQRADGKRWHSKEGIWR